MASRSLTDIFVLMRNTASQDRNFFSGNNDWNQAHSDRSTLIRDNLEDIQISVPPDWLHEFEEIQYMIFRVRSRVKDLAELQNQHLFKPVLDDSSEQNVKIERLTGDITKTLGKCHRGLNTIQSFLTQIPPGSAEYRLTKNVSTYLVNELQAISSEFKRAQSTYLNKLQSREERTSQYFKQPETFISPEEEDDPLQSDWPPVLTQQQQLLFLEENTAFAEQREREVNLVVKSIQDLNIIFTEIAQMVSDQGTILDRIDYNVEHASTSVQQGVVHLKKAESYQKSTWKMKCVLILAAVIVALIVLLVALKS